MSVDTTSAVRTIKQFYFTHKRLPTYDEIAELFSYASKNASLKLVNRLVSLDILEKDEKGRVTPKNLFAIPHLGIIKAGVPMESHEIPGDSLDLYHFLLQLPAHIFSLTVHGDSMQEEGIHEGDMVIVESGRVVKNGDIVAAIVDGAWTIKYFETKNGQISLIPANSAYKAIHPKERFEIAGVVIHVIRSYK